MLIHDINQTAGVLAPSLSAAAAFGRLPKKKIAPYVLLGLVCMGIGVSNLVSITSADDALFAAFDPVSSIALSAVLGAAAFFALTATDFPLVGGRVYLGLVGLIVGSTYALFQHPAALPFVRCFDACSSTYAVLAAIMGFAVALSREDIPRRREKLIGTVVVGAAYGTLNTKYYSLGDPGLILLHLTGLAFVALISLGRRPT